MLTSQTFMMPFVPALGSRVSHRGKVKHAIHVLLCKRAPCLQSICQVGSALLSGMPCCTINKMVCLPLTQCDQLPAIKAEHQALDLPWVRNEAHAGAWVTVQGPLDETNHTLSCAVCQPWLNTSITHRPAHRSAAGAHSSPSKPAMHAYCIPDISSSAHTRMPCWHAQTSF